MTGYIVRRLVHLVVVVVGVVTVTFFVLRLTGDPAALFASEIATAEEVEGIREALGFNDPLHEQYWRYVSGALQGDFGRSIRFGIPASQVVLDRVPATIQLSLAALAITVVLGVSAGVIAAVKRGSVWDNLTIALTLLGQSTPTFFLGILLIFIFAVTLRILPTSGRGGWEHLILPAITLGTWETARLARLVRSSMLGVLSADYIRTARSKGLPERSVVMRHAVSNGLLSAATVIGLSFSTLLGGAVITETIFSWPGIGALLVEAVRARDYAVLQTTVLAIAVMVALTTLLTDLVYVYLDPRIRLN